MVGWWVAVAVAGRPDAVSFVDSPSGRIRCHAEARVDEVRCAQVVAWAEEAWAAQVERLGFRAPLPDSGLGGSDAVDLYLSRVAGGPGKAFGDCDGGDPECLDADPGDGLATAPAYVVLDPRTRDRDFRHFVHHEFAHAVHYATDYAEPSLALWEGTATACERWTDPTWSTSAADLADFQRTPWLSTVLQDGYLLAELGIDRDSWYEYGAYAWVAWLDEAYGDGEGAVGPRLWASAARPGATVLDAWEEISGDWREALLDFTVARARMGTPHGPSWAAFAGRRGRAWREPVRREPFEPRSPPYPLGVTFLDVTGPLEVRVAGDPAVEWAVMAIGAVDAQELGPEGGPITLVGPVTLAVVNLGPPGFDGSGPELAPSSFVLRTSRAR